MRATAWIGRNGHALAVSLLLTVHAGLLAYSSKVHSPVVTEVGHLPAGLSHLYFGRFDLYRVNPPLVRMVAALPVALASPETNWTNYSLDPLVRSETQVGMDFVNANGERTFWLYTLGRWACIPFSLIGAWVCWRWARDLFGPAAGLAACALWCFCPNILGNAALIMPDAPAAALGAAACYTFWRWLKRPTWVGAVASGIALGLAELAKTTLLVLYPLWPLLWLVYRLPDRAGLTKGEWGREAAMVALRLIMGLYVINVGYGFEGSMQPLGDYQFQSATLTGISEEARGATGNRFAETWLGALPVPLPRNFVQGIDTQRLDFERGMPSYLGGHWSPRGWWYFYLYAMAIKLPLGTLLLIFAAAASMAVGRKRSAAPPRPVGEGKSEGASSNPYCVAWRDEMILITPAAAILILVSSQTGFSIHLRYVLPAFPFLFVFASRLFRAFELRRRVACLFCSAALAWSVGSSLWFFPHSLSYFNDFAGGPSGGHEHLLDSCISWGQDLLILKDWLDDHPEARPLNLAVVSFVNPRLAGIEFTLPPSHWSGESVQSGVSPNNRAPPPGCYAIDVNFLRGDNRAALDADGSIEAVNQIGRDLSWFLRLEPIARIGYSIYVYHIPPGR